MDNSEESFELLYNLAVGMERLLKVAVIFLEHDSTQDQEAFERSLITHNHLELLDRVKAHSNLALSGVHNEFLNLLGTFYKSFRYDRFNLSPLGGHDKEQVAVRTFLEKHLNVNFQDAASPFPNLNTPRFKKFLGRTVGKISAELYQLIEDRARALNLYTWERRYESKAAKVFLKSGNVEDSRRYEITFEAESVLLKEILLFFMNTTETSPLLSYLRSIEPLKFDKALAQDYLQCFQSEDAKRSVLDEMETLYEELEKPHDRLVALSPIGDPNSFFDSEDDEEDEDSSD